jgi:predicted GNAT family N-acyltransferase
VLRLGPLARSVLEQLLLPRVVLVVSRALSASDRALGRAIRRAVFVEEQSVSPELELDAIDDACQHFLVRVDGEAVATARARSTAEGWKFERVAVSKAHRGSAVGKALVRRMQAEAPHGALVYVHAQEGALGFWERLGFIAAGPRFFEAGIAHRKMRWSAGAAPDGAREGR